MLPTRVHAIVLVSKLHKPTLRALAFAKATRPNVLEGVYVADRHRRDRPAARGVGRAQHRRPAQGAALAVPRGGQADRRLRHGDPAGQPARRGRGLHPGVRRRPLVGAAAAQPDRAAAQGPAAVHARASWSPRCPTSCAPPQIAREREEREAGRVRPGDLRRGNGRPRAAATTGRSSDDPAAVTRRPAAAQARGRSRVGERFEAEVGPVAHGGHCVVRLPRRRRRRVVFVRHAIPGERVVVEITEGTEGDRFWRGDAVEVLEASPGPGRGAVPVRRARACCGGCDFQHVGARPRSARSRPTVVREQLSRLAGLDVRRRRSRRCPATRTACAGGPGSATSRCPTAGAGMRKHRSHDVVPVDDCLIEAPRRRSSRRRVRRARLRGRRRTASGRCTPARREVLVETVLELLAPQPGETVLDLYAGVGLFAPVPRRRGRARRPGRARSRATATACGTPRRNLARRRARTAGDVGRPGAGDGVRRAVRPGRARPAARGREAARSWSRSSTGAPRAVAYVACDPAALARDVAIFAEHGYRLRALRAFDLFPMTHHVECVALLGRCTLSAGRSHHDVDVSRG